MFYNSFFSSQNTHKLTNRKSFLYKCNKCNRLDKINLFYFPFLSLNGGKLTFIGCPAAVHLTHLSV